MSDHPRLASAESCAWLAYIENLARRRPESLLLIDPLRPLGPLTRNAGRQTRSKPRPAPVPLFGAIVALPEAA